jgi:DNA-binding transcriptional LysR family regulator
MERRVSVICLPFEAVVAAHKLPPQAQVWSPHRQIIARFCIRNGVSGQNIFAPSAAMDGGDLEDVLAFMAVLDLGSFTAGGRRLGRDPSIVSRRVTALEARLGTRLLERSTRRLAPTEAGSLFYRRMRAALAVMEEAEAAVTHAGGVAAGLLRLALPATFGRMWIAPLLPEFLAAHPKVSIEADFSDRHVDLIGERYDLAIRIGDLQDSRLIARKLAANERLVYASPSYLAAHGTPATPEELSGHACLVNPRFEGHPEWRFRNGESLSVVRVNSRFAADDPQSLVTAAVAGLGIAVCARWLTVSECKNGQLVPILSDWTFEKGGSIYLVRPSARFTPGKTNTFVEWITRKFSEPTWLA